LWTRTRFQVAVCLVVAALLPYLARLLTRPSAEPLSLLNQTLVASVCAIILGTWLYRQWTTYPGVEQGSHILPAFSISYGLALAGILLTRTDYNRTVLFCGYAFSILCFYTLYLLVDRRDRLKVGLLGPAYADELFAMDRVKTVVLQSINANVDNLDAVAVDFGRPITPEWERRLTDWALRGIPVYNVKHLLESLTGRVAIEQLSENSLTSFSARSVYVAMKLPVDWLIAAVAGIALFPVLLIVAIAIRLESPGPAIFRQCRIGYRGVPFTVFKFRTMTHERVEDGDERTSAITESDDRRITGLGRFLRRTRIDELPQLVNVLRCEMSWIGPRPEAEVLSRWYESEISFYRYRHLVRPGMTGWAQVNQGHVTQVAEVKSKLHFDFYYINNFSPWIDLLIVIRTFRIVFTGFGAK